MRIREVGGGNNDQADNQSSGSVSLIRSSYEVITHRVKINEQKK